MDSGLDSSDHRTSFHPKEVNLYSQKFSFFTTILQFFRFLLKIFGISFGDEEDTVWTSEFMLHEDEDLTGRISDTIEQEDPPNAFIPEFENGVQTSEIKDFMESNFISPAEKDPPNTFIPEFENGVQTSEIKDFMESNFISPAEKDPPNTFIPEFENGVQTSEIKDFMESNFISPAEKDPPNTFIPEFENGVQTSEIKDFMESNFISPAEKDPPNTFIPEFENGVQTSEIKDFIESNFISPAEKDPSNAFIPEFENGVQTSEIKDLIESNFISPAEKDPSKAFIPEFENGVQTSEITGLIQSNFLSSPDKESSSVNSTVSRNDFERPDIEELIECILSEGPSNDCNECTAEIQTGVQTSEGEDLILSNSISSQEEGDTCNSVCDANSGFVSSTSKTVSKEIKEAPLSTPDVVDHLKISNENSVGTCLASELKTNKDCKGEENKSPTTTDAGKQDVRDEYSKGQYRSNPKSSQLEQEVNMAATSNKEVSLNDLDKNSRAVKRTKGSLPNIPGENSESCWADAVDQKECSLAGVGPFMCHLFEKQLYTDVTFYFKETKSFFSAHRVVLAARCDYFEKLLFGKQMNNAVGMEMHVQINDVPLSTFTSIVKYLYTDAIKLVDDCDALETYRAAKMYRIHRLKNVCKTYINSIELTENNACFLLELCNSKHIYELKTRYILYIQKNTSHVIRSKDFEKCCYSTVREICLQDVLNLNSEEELLEAVIRWIDLQKTSKQCKTDFRRGLLKQVRLLTFTPREFSEVLQRYPQLLTPEEGLKILMALNNPCPDTLNNLPKWCNKQTIRRTVQAGQTSIPKSVVEQGDRRWISITLKPLKKRLQSGPLTCLLHLKCLEGVCQITRVTFSLDNVAAEGCAFKISIAIIPDGPSFHKTHSAMSKESVLTFEKPVSVQAGQTFEMKATAESYQSCQFLQFDKWYSDWLDFMSFFISKPMADRLYFISGIEYEPV